MATTKITVTVPEELATYIKEQVAEGRFDSVSAYITRAAENYRDFDPLDLVIASMIAEAGEPDESFDAVLDAATEAAHRAGQDGSIENAA